MKKLVIEMKIITDGMVHHVPEAFLNFEVFLAAIVAIFPFEGGAAVKAIIFVPVMFFHFLMASQLLNNGKNYITTSPCSLYLLGSVPIPESKRKNYCNYQGVRSKSKPYAGPFVDMSW
jgi:hypothetical protein